MKKMNKKGFTLIEMLVVIAIIAILVSIIIPVVSSSTDKAKCATNAANLRSLQAEYTTITLTSSAPDVSSLPSFGSVKFYDIEGKGASGASAVVSVSDGKLTYKGWTAVQWAEQAGEAGSNAAVS